MPERADVMSFGGGKQTCAMVELVLQGRIPRPERIVIADTGREGSETWEYAKQEVVPRLARIGLSLEIAPHALATVDLQGKNGDLLMPLYTRKEGKLGQLPNFCSYEWKKRVVMRYLRRQGYGPKRPVRLWLGISTDEAHRAGTNGTQWCENHFPLLYDVPMRRSDCVELLLAAGWPEPPKSSCWMCPFRGNAQWKHLRDSQPADWAKAVELDHYLRTIDPQVYVHRSGVPLDQANLEPTPPPPGTPPDQIDLFGGCDSGYCYV